MLGIRRTGQEDPYKVQQGEVQTEQLHVSVQLGTTLAAKVLGPLVVQLNVAYQCTLAAIKTPRSLGCISQRVALKLRIVLSVLYSSLLILHPE